MAEATFTIENKLPSLNEYINVCRKNKYAGNKFKQDTESLISVYLHDVKPFSSSSRVFIEFIWCEKTKKRDPDNIASAKKYILDALVKNGIIPNDNAKHIAGFKDEFIFDSANYVKVTIKEV